MKLSSPYDVILGPVMTEKSTLGSEHNQVTFRVAPAATKPMIKKAVETLFGVKVTGVNTLNMKGKTKTFRGIKGRRAGFKKAMISLADGETIDITTGI
jgi:large subunit ribosomal protein L23